jgi:hypothetical protein
MEVIMEHRIWVASLICLGLSACASSNAGNPDGNAYAGSAGSAYDATANAPRTNGTVSYNPNAPLPQAMPSADMQAPSAMPAGSGGLPR